MAEQGIAVVTVPDNRWGRVDIKSISLLPNVLAKQAAREQGAREAWFVGQDGKVTEGSSSNAWIVTGGREGGHPRRRHGDPARHHPGRADRRDRGAGPDLEERPFTVAEALAAREAFLTSATQIVMPIVQDRR